MSAIFGVGIGARGRYRGKGSDKGSTAGVSAAQTVKNSVNPMTGKLGLPNWHIVGLT